MKYFTASGAEYTVDSLKADGSHTYTKYTNCDVLAHAKPLGVRLEIRGGEGNYQGGLVTYRSNDKQLENKIPLIRYSAALEKGLFLFHHPIGVVRIRPTS